MKKTFFILSSATLLLSSFSFKHYHGSGELAATGAPGEGNCSGCHSGGVGVTTVSISSIPAFTNNAFDPLTTYTINVTVSNPSLSVYGFDCVILGSSNTSIGTMTNPGTGVQLATAFNGRRNATHNPKQSGSGSYTFSFRWISPNLGNATIYAAGNAVNNNNNSSGDLPSTAVLTLSNVNTAVKEEGENDLRSVQVYPNPASDLLKVSYVLDHSSNMEVILTDISGKVVSNLLKAEQAAGPHSHFFDVKDAGKGIFFLKLISDRNTLSQKMVCLQ